MTTKLKELKQVLQDAKDSVDNYHGLCDSVIEWITSRTDNIEEAEIFFEDLLQHGCVSGMVSHLIYYTDTAQYYDEFYDEIEELRENFEDETGAALKINGDLKNWFAWFAFEEIVRKMYCYINPNY